MKSRADIALELRSDGLDVAGPGETTGMGVVCLIIASLVWAPSFGLIKLFLGGVDPNLAAWLRLVLSFCLFLPFLRSSGLPVTDTVGLMATGAIQYGLMYMFYMYSFSCLAGHQVALFTVLTPVYVAIMDDLYTRRIRPGYLWAALLAVAGGAAVCYDRKGCGVMMTGFLLVQVSNLCFAFGQVRYRQWKKRHTSVSDERVFALMYLGAVLMTSIPAALTTEWRSVRLSTAQILLIVYLGLVPSGISLFLWNYGAARTSAGMLAVFNNVKIPLAVTCALMVFGESAGLVRLGAGAGLLASAVVLAEWYSRRLTGANGLTPVQGATRKHKVGSIG